MSNAIEAPTGPTTLPQRFAAALPIGVALLLIAGVWVAGAVWSFEEQTRFAQSNGFKLPELLPLVLDGMAVAMAAVSWAASLDARPAVFARLGTALAVACSSASNTAWAWERSHGDPQTIALAGGVPIVANLAFEVLLSEVRRQVLRRRGQPGPVAITYPRMVRLVLAPWPTFVSWRRLVLTATDPAKSFDSRPPIRAEAVDENDPGIQLCRRLEREMAAARQSISPHVARVALADRALSIWSAPEPARWLMPAVREPGAEPSRPVAPEPRREPEADSPKSAAAAQRPARRSVTQTVREPAQKSDDKKLAQAYARLTKKLGREPSGPELGEAAGVSKATANRWKKDRISN